VTVSKGQEWDWLGDPFWRVLRERNLAACCIIILTAFAVLYAASTSLPALLHSLFGYDALSAELVMSRPGFFAVVTMSFVRLALGRGTDARWVRGSVDCELACNNDPLRGVFRIQS
jgi:DHA2 family multidrug resistance protein